LDLLTPEQTFGALRDWGELILALERSPDSPFSKHPSPPIFSDEDREIFRQAVQQMRTAEPELFGLLAQVSVLSRERTLARKLFELTALIASAAFLIGAHGGMTDTARAYFERSRASYMRKRRATSSQEQELRAAIEKAVENSKGKIPSGKRYKDAESIKAVVNARVSKPVSVDAIARRIAALSENSKK
jgi:hypothetical protein